MRSFITKCSCFVLFFISYILSSLAIADDSTGLPQVVSDSSSLVPTNVKTPVKRGFVLVKGQMPNMQCNIVEQIRHNCEFMVSKKTCPADFKPEVFIAPSGNAVPNSRFCSLKSYIIATPKIISYYDSYYFEFSYAYAHFLNFTFPVIGHVACPDQPISITYAVYCV